MSSANTVRGFNRRSMHVITSSAKTSPSKSAARPHKSPLNGFAALASREQAPQMSSARDIEMLLSNIGADYRASRITIESMIQGTGAPKADPQPSKLSGIEIIDLIAQIRSI
ncbi:hypothetical protein ACHAXN_002337 [Cyclotella atomus]